VYVSAVARSCQKTAMSAVVQVFGRSLDAAICLESGAKQKCRAHARSDAIDPSRTSQHGRTKSAKGLKGRACSMIDRDPKARGV
jgi:hypothetical protein